MVGGQDGSQRRRGSENEQKLEPGAVEGEGASLSPAVPGLPAYAFWVLTSSLSPGGREAPQESGQGRLNMNIQNCMSVLADGR